jgi:hypothetical protein
MGSADQKDGGRVRKPWDVYEGLVAMGNETAGNVGQRRDDRTLFSKPGNIEISIILTDGRKLHDDMEVLARSGQEMFRQIVERI